MTDIYFNGRSWRRLGLSEQEIKFLERLADALKALEASTDADSTTVSTLSTTLAALQSTVSSIASDVDALEVEVGALDEDDDLDLTMDYGSLVATIDDFNYRITQLEDGL